LHHRREVAEALILRMDELLPSFVFERPPFAIAKPPVRRTASAAVLDELEPLLNSVEAQLEEITSSRFNLKQIEKELDLMRAKK